MLEENMQDCAVAWMMSKTKREYRKEAAVF